MNEKNEVVDREDLRRQIGEIYERVVQWIVDKLEIDAEDIREPLHKVAQQVLAMPKPQIQKLERYLTRAAIRAYRRSLGNGKKIKPIPFSRLSKGDLAHVFEIQATTPDPAEQAVENEILAMAKAEIEKMPERRRDVMRLHFTGLSAKEIGARLGIKPSTVRSQIRYVTKFLVKKFGFAKEFSVARNRLQKPRTGRRAAKRRAARGGEATSSETS